MKDNKRLSTEVQTIYSLRRFKNARDPNFVEALKIYTRTITPEAHTNTNEITYWLDRGYGEFGDEFCVFGFFKEDRVVGFAQLAYFRGERILFFDYLVLSKDERAHGEYYAFAGQLQKWVDASGLEIDYVVAEVSYDCGGSTPS
ncbi:MAG: hypothetical protein Q8O00_04860, partial [Holophaga sp.]|nr:hypothetical protein [Holophaga sp.]